MKETETVQFLVVEDDDLDFKILTRSFKKLRLANPIIRAMDGSDALDILKGDNGKEKLQQPYIILLDINMPKMNGLEFLKVMRADDNIKHSIVFILTTSNADSDLYQAYENNIAGYIIKKDPENGFMDAIKMIDSYWRVVQLPSASLRQHAPDVD